LTDRESLNSSFDTDLNAPADFVPAHPPLITRVQVLPFGELTWENFERLCYRLAGRAERVEYVARYGRSGQAQQGIDLFARMATGKYEVWQAKRYGSIASSDVKTIVNTFRAGTWKDKSEQLILAVQASLADAKVQDEIEAQARALKAEGITFVPRGGEELSELLRGHPEVVDDFFGRGWVEAFLGLEAAKALGVRLDGAEFARVRAQLRRFYDAHFHLLDVGVVMPLAAADAVQDAPPSLLRRFAVPDVLVRNTITDEQRAPHPDESQVRSDASAGAAGASGETRQPIVRRRDLVRRASLSNWLADGLHLAVVGDAGSGKSMLLRCIALDLLTDQRVFPQIARRWGGLLPIHISFSRWSRLSARLGRAAGLKEVVAETLQPALTADLLSLLDRAVDERRVLLLLDGLDEWSDEQAARTTLQHILAFVATHSLPTIATARPRGLDKIGSIPPGWRTAELAPLSLDQQRTLAEVWFSRGLARAAASEQGQEIRAPIEERLDRFFAELARDRRLSSLAGNPLLLVGLVALSVRHIALPRNRMQAIQSLVAILGETHPEHRATAAGDTKARFVHIPEAEDRRAALGRLAFVARSASGGGTYDIKEARRTIRDYLADATTFAYPAERAQNAASEMLAVNAETVGLLAERAPGEIGFAHAVFEEYLAAEHIHRWAFPDITAFVRERSGNPLWRSVISNLVSLLARPTEVESVVVAIETARADEASREGAISRDVLLADIAFNSSRKPPATSQRLVDRAFEIIEGGDWMLARREVLKAALTNVGEATSPTSVDDRLALWTPRRAKYLSYLFEALGGWKPSPDLRDVLLGGLHDEERDNQRTAARALVSLYAGDEGVQQRLMDTLRSTLDLSVAAAALEALTLGWPETPGLSVLHDAAFTSREPTLRLVGISGHLGSGRANQGDRDGLVSLLSDVPDIDFWDQPAARMLLSLHWPDDPTLIDIAVKSVRRDGGWRDEFERESAMHYLIRCSPTNPTVADWVRRELKEKYPFLLAHDDLWDCVAPFAIEHPDIRASVIACVRSEFGRHSLHYFQSLIIKLGGDELRDALIGIARDDKGWSEFWAVRPLLEGWGRSDPVVASIMDEIASWSDKRLDNLAAILPQILTDFDACRARLLSLARNSERPRFDLIARGLAALGCTAEDTEAVDTLLAAVGRGAPAFDPGVVLLTHFSTNPRVRQYAQETLRDRAPPLAALARAYENDAGIRPQILAYANPLPVTLRGDIAEAASGEANSHPAFERVLKGYDVEADGELKISASIHYHRYVARTSGVPSAGHMKELVDALHAVGPDLHERRAAAFAGMLLLGRVNEIVPMTDYGDKPLHIQSGKGYRNESDSLMALMCERWEDVRQAFGVDLAARFGDFGADEGHLWDCLATHINASPAARRDFLAFCSQTDTTLGLRSFIALTREQPSSELLLNHCWRVFGREVTGQHERHSAWAVQRIRLEIAYILRDQFRDRTDVKERLREALKRGRSAEVVALALVEPNDPLFDQLRYGPREISQQFSDWVAALHLASARSGAEEFVEVALAMINREFHGIWNFQEITNRAVVERLQRDPETVRRLKDKLASNPTESETASLPRYLMAAGALDDDVHERCRSLLQDEARHALPRAGYDAVDNSTRAVSRSLLEVLAPSLSP
jgi:CRP-like cAMP-binding protein